MGEKINVFTSGTCRLLHLFEESFNDIDKNIKSIHYSNHGQNGGYNFIGLAHTIQQHLFFLKIIYGDIIINEDNCQELAHLFVMLSTRGDYRENYLKVMGEYDFFETVKKIRDDINHTNIFIFEISSIKDVRLKNSKFDLPVFMDINNIKDDFLFKININDENILKNDTLKLTEYIKSKNENAHIIFIGYMRNWIFDKTHPIIKERNMTAMTLLTIKNNKNIFYIDPTKYLSLDDLEDNRHYNNSGKKKILTEIVNIIKNKIYIPYNK